MADKKSYKKKKLDVTFGGGIYDDEYVTEPRASMGIGKGDSKLDFTVRKPFSKKTKENISSEIGLGYTKEGKNSSFNVTGTKRGKSKDLSFNYSRSFTNGGYNKHKDDDGRKYGPGPTYRGKKLRLYKMPVLNKPIKKDIFEASKGAYTGSYIKSELDGKKVSNKSYEKYYKGMIDV